VITYTRSNHDLSPVEPVYDPRIIPCRVREQVQDSFYYLDKNLSLPKDVAQIIDELDFDTLFVKTFFKSKSKTNLDNIGFNEKRF
jgi:hypothetical protein